MPKLFMLFSKYGSLCSFTLSPIDIIDSSIDVLTALVVSLGFITHIVAISQSQLLD